MSEVSEVPKLQSEQEKELTQDELRDTVDELGKLFEERFENSVVKRRGKPQEVQSPYIDELPTEIFKRYSDPRILVYSPPRAWEEYKDEPFWRVDQSEKDKLVLVTRKGRSRIWETVTITGGEFPSVQVKIEDKHSDKTQPRQPDQVLEGTKTAIDIARDIIASMPQVKN